MKLRIILVDETQTVNEMIRESLEAAGHDVVAKLSLNQNLVSYVLHTLPDMLVINVKMTDQTFLHNISEVNRVQPVPVLFSELDSQDMMDDIIQCGVSAYVVDGLEANRLEPIINISIARFNQIHELRWIQISA